MKLADTRLGPILEAVTARAKVREATGRGFKEEAVHRTSQGKTSVESLKEKSLAIIAECKRRSPSAGNLADEPDLLKRALRYAKEGASVISILTEQDGFGGSLEDFVHLQTVSSPRLRKDFIVNSFMVDESARVGADFILLMAVCLEGSQLSELCAQAQEQEMAVLMEVHDEEELSRAINAKPDCIGVNARDLRTFDVDLQTAETLLPIIPPSFIKIAESGLQTYDDLLRVKSAGADAALIGTAFMKDPEKLGQWTKNLREDFHA